MYMAGCFIAMMMLWILRREFGGLVASNPSVFRGEIITLGVGVLLQGIGFVDATRRARHHLDIPAWRHLCSAIVDLGVPFVCLFILQQFSPRGATAALSAPSILLLPLVLVISVLRLRKAYPASLGVIAAIGHWVLAWRAAQIDELDSSMYPVVFSYGVLLVLTGFAASIVTAYARRYIEEAVRESEDAERATRNLAKVEHELNIARDVQQGLLPAEPPHFPGFEIAGMARAATQAGGDYWDWQTLPDGSLLIVIADVTGHGVGPALVMAVCRAYARATAPSATNTSEFLSRLNSLILADVKGARFISMAAARISCEGSVGLLSAGHGPTFVFRASSKSIERFDGDGLPLGVAPDEAYDPTHHLNLAPGDLLVMLTDGFMERFNPDGEQFGIERLERVIAVNADQTASELIRSLDDAATTFARGTPQGDDMTIVIVRKL
jgi:serine phosphatase RsbU (regulator of sigma subunit)